MLRWIVITCLLGCFSQVAMAQKLSTKGKKAHSGVAKNTSISQYNFVPAKDQSTVSVQTTRLHKDINYKIKQGGGSEKDFETTTGYLLTARADYGWEDNWGLHAEVSTPMPFFNTEVSRRHAKMGRLKGFSDIEIGARKNTKWTTGQLFYGGHVTLSHTDRVWGSDREDGTLTSGGHAISGHVGLQRDNKKYVYGGLVSYDILNDRKESYKSDAGINMNLTRSKGNIFGAKGFVESSRKGYILGGRFGMDFVQATDYSFTARGNTEKYSTDSHQVMNFGAYGRLTLKDYKQLEILPSLDISRVFSGSGGSMAIESGTEETRLAVTGRWTL